ncbi:MAG: EI24 domain-containing protein, partial [Bdellovibrionales bacterium]|nr:EI24 domain-containing protein [Bdellovibrionales bacterium]
PEPSGFWQQTLYVLAWIAGALFLLMISMILSLIFVLIFSGINQSAIAERILADRGLLVVAHGGAVKDVVKEASRSVCTEIVKLLWLLPLGLLCVVIGLVPILSPFALLLAAWLLAYEFVDIALDVLRLSVRARLRFALQKAPLLIAFGLTLSVCWAVPFLGIALAPVAAAAAAWLIAEVGIPQSSSLKGGGK